MPNENKIKLVEKIKQRISDAKSVIFVDYKGLSANKLNELRSQLADNDSTALVAKNTLIKLALKECKYEYKEISETLKGNTMVILSFSDALTGVKTLFKFNSENSLPEIKAGIVEGKFLDFSKLEQLNKLPSREELLAKVVYSLKSPISGLVNVLNGNQRNFVYVINAIKDKKEVTNNV